MKMQPKIARMLWSLGLILFMYALVKDFPFGAIGTLLMGVATFLDWGEDD